MMDFEVTWIDSPNGGHLYISPEKVTRVSSNNSRDLKNLDFEWILLIGIWGFPKMLVPNNHGFSY